MPRLKKNVLLRGRSGDGKAMHQAHSGHDGGADQHDQKKHVNRSQLDLVLPTRSWVQPQLHRRRRGLARIEPQVGRDLQPYRETQKCGGEHQHKRPLRPSCPTQEWKMHGHFRSYNTPQPGPIDGIGSTEDQEPRVFGIFCASAGRLLSYGCSREHFGHPCA